MTASPLGSVDGRIAGLRSTLQQIAENLVELDSDVTRQMLESSSSLAGRTAEAWGLAKRRLAEVWQGQLALDDVLEALAHERGSKSSISRAMLQRLTDLLDGPSVSCAPTGADLAHRSLTDRTMPSVACTIDELIDRMSADYDAIVAFVGEVAAIWADTVPRLADLESTVTELESLAANAGTRRPNDIVTVRRRIAHAEELARNDPLSVAPDLVSSISLIVERARVSIQDDAAARHELDTGLAKVATSIDWCDQALKTARADRQKAASKIMMSEDAWTDFDQADADLAELRRDLEHLHGLAGTNPAGAGLQAPEVLDRATRLCEQVNGLLVSVAHDVATRDELRGRLDAYRAKAQATGRGEDLDLERLYCDAKELLYTAPCDLFRAGELVAAFQRAIRTGPSGAN